MKKLKIGLVSIALSASALTLLVHCAPKDSKKDAINTKNDTSALIAGIDFSALDKDKTTGSNSAKALLKTLKEGKTPDAQIISMALLEANLTADEKSGDNTMAVLGKIADYSAKSEAKKPEELKKIYDLIEKDLNRNMRTDSQSTSVWNVSRNGTVQDYSGTLFLSLALLKSPTMTDRSKDIIYIEDGRERLGEIRSKNIQVLDSVTKGTAVRDMGTLEDLVKNSDTKRIVLVDLFLIHESLKPYAADPKAWALNIEKASNKALDLAIDEKKVITNSAKVDKAQAGQSEILIGTPRSLPTADLASEEVAPAAAPAKPAASGDAPATPQDSSPEVKPAAGNIPTAPAKSYAGVTYGASCVKVADFQKTVADNAANKVKNLLALYVQESTDADGKVKDPSVPSILLRLEALDVKDLTAKDADLGKALSEALKQSANDKKSFMVLTLVRAANGSTVGQIKSFDKDTQKPLNDIGGAIGLKSTTVEYLKTSAKNAKASEDKAQYIEMVANCP